MLTTILSRRPPPASPARFTPYHPFKLPSPPLHWFSDAPRRLAVRCAPCQVHGILQRAGRLHDTSLVVVGDHGEGFELAHEQDRVHGGTVYDTQVLSTL